MSLHGLYVAEVAKGSPAEAAGLHRGDLILRINGRSVAERKILRHVRKGHDVVLDVHRNNATTSVMVGPAPLGLTFGNSGNVDHGSFGIGCVGFVAFVLFFVLSMLGTALFGPDTGVPVALLMTPAILFVAQLSFRATDRRNADRETRETETRVLEESAEANKLRDAVRVLASRHANALGRKRRRLFVADEYGIVDQEKWRDEVELFLVRVAGLDGSYQADGLFQIVDRVAAGYEDLRPASKMSGVDFEHHCAAILRRHGWQVRVTRATSDQGVDLVAELNSTRVVIQCKNWAASVGNSAVQEVEAGRQFERAEFGCVVARSFNYTRSAKELARATGTVLLDVSDLAMLAEVIGL